MDQAVWSAVDAYLCKELVGSDPALEAILAANAQAQLPAIDVTPNQGKLLHLLARMCSAKRILEVGTLGGYSTTWLARAVPPGGAVVTLEREAKHAAIAASNLSRAGLAGKVDIRLGPALDSLQQLASERCPPFDLIFIDADKPNTPAYLALCLQLSRPGTVIVADNVVRDGAIIDAESTDASVQGMRTFFSSIGANKRLSATAIQTVGGKGYDGFALAIVEDRPAVE